MLIGKLAASANGLRGEVRVVQVAIVLPVEDARGVAVARVKGRKRA